MVSYSAPHCPCEEPVLLRIKIYLSSFLSLLSLFSLLSFLLFFSSSTNCHHFYYRQKPLQFSLLMPSWPLICLRRSPLVSINIESALYSAYSLLSNRQYQHSSGAVRTVLAQLLTPYISPTCSIGAPSPVSLWSAEYPPFLSIWLLDRPAVSSPFHWSLLLLSPTRHHHCKKQKEPKTSQKSPKRARKTPLK